MVIWTPIQENGLMVYSLIFLESEYIYLINSLNEILKTTIKLREKQNAEICSLY